MLAFFLTSSNPTTWEWPHLWRNTTPQYNWKLQTTSTSLAAPTSSVPPRDYENFLHNFTGSLLVQWIPSLPFNRFPAHWGKRIRKFTPYSVGNKKKDSKFLQTGSISPLLFLHMVSLYLYGFVGKCLCTHRVRSRRILNEEVLKTKTEKRN